MWPVSEKYLDAIRGEVKQAHRIDLDETDCLRCVPKCWCQQENPCPPSD